MSRLINCCQQPAAAATSTLTIKSCQLHIYMLLAAAAELIQSHHPVKRTHNNQHCQLPAWYMLVLLPSPQPTCPLPPLLLVLLLIADCCTPFFFPPELPKLQKNDKMARKQQSRKRTDDRLAAVWQRFFPNHLNCNSYFLNCRIVSQRPMPFTFTLSSVGADSSFRQLTEAGQTYSAHPPRPPLRRRWRMSALAFTATWPSASAQPNTTQTHIPHTSATA